MSTALSYTSMVSISAEEYRFLQTFRKEYELMKAISEGEKAYTL
jgi:hypothetical protein